jgi:hypothetical protein
LKTTNSTRILPLSGYAIATIAKALKKSDKEWAHPRWIRAGNRKADCASAAIHKWLKKGFGSDNRFSNPFSLRFGASSG